MAKIVLLFTIIFVGIQFSFSQDLPVPAEGKALVIFTRPAIDAPLLKFTYFDDEQFLGKIGTKDYIAYACNPGKHLLWAKAENQDFLEAELEADKIYLIETKVTTGILKARIGLVPYDPEVKSAEKLKKRLLARITKRNEIRADAATAQTVEDDDIKTTIEKGMAEYQKRKEKGKKIDVLTPDMHI